METTLLHEVYNHPNLTKIDLEKIVDAHELIRLSKGSILLQDGDISKCYYILISGSIRSYVVDYLGREHTTQLYLPKEVVIEEASLFHQIATQETFVCISDCELWKMNIEVFNKFFVEIPALAEWGRNWMSYQLLLSKQSKIDLIKESALTRYTKLITTKPEILQKVPLKYIASYLGITDSSLSRIRKDMAIKE